MIDFVSRAEQRFHKTRSEQMVQREKLRQEVQKYDDILVMPVLETYRNLPLKMLQFMYW